MGSAVGPAASRWLGAVRMWPIWQLPSWLLVYVLSVIVADVAAIIAGLSLTSYNGHDLRLFAVLLICDCVTVELTRRAGEPAGLIKEVHAVWELPAALLLPPPYGMLIPIVRIALTQWRVRKALLYRRVFTASAVGLSYGAGSVVFHALGPGLTAAAAGVYPWLLAVVATGVLRSAVNKLLVMVAVKGADPATSVRSSLFSRDAIFGDSAEMSVAVLIAYAAPATPLMALVGLPIVTVLQRALRVSQLTAAARIDDMTGLLNKKTWRREAAVQVTRAARHGSGRLAVLMVDVDNFKTEVNDKYGHLTGDAMLAAIGAVFRKLVREYDLCGRYGGEEFSVLLPDASEIEARHAARRLCTAISGLAVPAVGGAIPAATVRATVSIGVAVMDGEHRELDALIGAADAALYLAKASGKNTVRLFSDADRGKAEQVRSAGRDLVRRNQAHG